MGRVPSGRQPLLERGHRLLLQLPVDRQPQIRSWHWWSRLEDGQHLPAGIDLDPVGSGRTTEHRLVAGLHPGQTDLVVRQIALGLQLLVLSLVDLADITEDVGRGGSHGAVGANGFGGGQYSGEKTRIFLDVEDLLRLGVGENGNRRIRAVLQVVDGGVELLDSHAQQRRQAIDHGRVLVRDLTVDLDHRLVDVADQDPAVAVQDVAAGSRGVNRL